MCEARHCEEPTQNIVIAAGQNDLINMAGNSGVIGIIGAAGDTIIGGSGIANIEGAAGECPLSAT